MSTRSTTRAASARPIRTVAVKSFLVMESVFEEHGEFAAGSYVPNPPTSRHTPGWVPGRTLFVRLWQFALADRKHVELGTASSGYGGPTGGRADAAVPTEQFRA